MKHDSTRETLIVLQCSSEYILREKTLEAQTIMCIVTSSLAAKKIRSCVDAFRKLNTLSNQSVTHRQSKVVESPGISFATESLSSQQRNLFSKEMCPLSIYSQCFLRLLIPHCRFRSHGIIFLAPRVNVGRRRTTPTPTLLLRWRIL